MPFINQPPRPFTVKNISQLKPGQKGVYGIFREAKWIYIGAGDIREKLLAHIKGDNPCITSADPTHWVAEIVKGDPSEREQQLIDECNPSCNKKVTAHVPERGGVKK